MMVDLNNDMIGTLVVTRDGAELGKLKEILGPGFKIDCHLAADYWLPLDVVESAQPNRILVRLDAHEVNAYKTHPPTAAGWAEDDEEPIGSAGAEELNGYVNPDNVRGT